MALMRIHIGTMDDYSTTIETATTDIETSALAETLVNMARGIDLEATADVVRMISQ